MSRAQADPTHAFAETFLVDSEGGIHTTARIRPEDSESVAPKAKRLKDNEVHAMYDQLRTHLETHPPPAGTSDGEVLRFEVDSLLKAYPNLGADFPLADAFKGILEKYSKKVLEAASAVGKLDVAIARLTDLKAKGLVAHSIRIKCPEFVSPLENVKTDITAKMDAELKASKSRLHDLLMDGKRAELAHYKKELETIGDALLMDLVQISLSSLSSSFSSVTDVRRHVVVNFAVCSTRFKSILDKAILDEINRQTNVLARAHEKAKAKAEEAARRAEMEVELNPTLKEYVTTCMDEREKEKATNKTRREDGPESSRRREAPARHGGAGPSGSRAPQTRQRTPSPSVESHGRRDSPQTGNQPSRRPPTTTTQPRASSPPRHHQARRPSPPRDPSRHGNQGSGSTRAHYPTARWNRDNPQAQPNTRAIHSYYRRDTPRDQDRSRRDNSGNGASARGGSSR